MLANVKKFTITLFILTIFLSSSSENFALDQKEINACLKNFHDQNIQFPTSSSSKSQCTNCTNQSTQISDTLPSILVFASFSMPDGMWLTLSSELEKVGGAFILQGLPSNSFKELANKIYELRQKNVRADIQLYPQLFQEYSVEKVPTFVLREKENEWNKLAGTVSLDFALSQFERQGSSLIAPLLLTKLRDNSL